MKKKIIPHCQNSSIRKIIERVKIYNRTFPGLVQTLQLCQVKLILWAQTSLYINLVKFFCNELKVHQQMH